MNQTAAPVQFGDVLAALQSDTRADLQIFLKEYSKGLEGKGAEGFNESIELLGDGLPATPRSSTTPRSGQEPTRDLQRVLKGQQKTFAALVEDEEALKGLVTNLNITAGAFAREDVGARGLDPGAARHAAGRLAGARLAQRRAALAARASRVDALPGVRSSRPTLDASLPVHPPGPRAGLAARAARRPPSRAAPDIPNLVTAQQALQSRCSRGPRALVAAPTRCSCPSSERRSPTPTSPATTTSRSAARSSARLRRPLRREPPLRRQHASTSTRAAGARTRCSVQPVAARAAATSRRTRRPDVPCETQEPPNLTRRPRRSPRSAACASGGGSPAARAAAPGRAQLQGRAADEGQEADGASSQRSARSAGRPKEPDKPTSRGGAASEERDPQAPRRLPRDHRAVRARRRRRRLHPVQPAPALPARRRRSRSPLKVELPNAQAVQPGQGQTVRVAGVEIGEIGKVELEDGKARRRARRSSRSTRR